MKKGRRKLKKIISLKGFGTLTSFVYLERNVHSRCLCGDVLLEVPAVAHGGSLVAQVVHVEVVDVFQDQVRVVGVVLHSGLSRALQVLKEKI